MMLRKLFGDIGVNFRPDVSLASMLKAVDVDVLPILLRGVTIYEVPQDFWEGAAKIQSLYYHGLWRL